ncbi:MAG: FlgD immunoglobulin-like domain containing protein [Phycisphaeraceae bacterium]
MKMIGMCVVFLAAALSSVAHADEPADAPVDAAEPGVFRYTLDEDAARTSAGIYDADGRLVRTLWTKEPRAVGTHTAEWDGRDVFDQPAPLDEPYTFRVVVNRSTYKNVGVLGNTGDPPNRMQHIQHDMRDVCVGDDGNIYTANGWEEIGHDFKAMNADGKTLFHAHHKVRNGKPSSLPYAITVGDEYIYCSAYGMRREPHNNMIRIHRFRIDNGKPAPFTGPATEDTDGRIHFYEWPTRQIPEDTPERDAELMAKPVQAMAVVGDTLIATDALGGKIHKFDKHTGEKLGAFPVPLPHALAVDAQKRLWIGHEHGNVSVYTMEGQRLGGRIDDVGEIESLCFGPEGLLYVADGEANHVRIYDVTDGAELVRTFGEPARPGDHRPDQFYSLRGAAVDASGHMVTIDNLPTRGARMARFAPDGTFVWQHMGLMFCTIGNYAQSEPDTVITQRFHRMALTDKDAGTWEYRGTVLDGDRRYVEKRRGVPRLLEFDGNQFYFQGYGDGLQIYRREDGVYRLATMVGGNSPRPDGRPASAIPPEEREVLSPWSWTDQDADGVVEASEITRFEALDRYRTFNMNADRSGNLIYCDLRNKAIWELPMAGLDENGNPTYDWTQQRQLVPADESAAGFHPLMAVRADDGTLYATGRSEAWERPGGRRAEKVWMGGWVARRYDKEGEPMWTVRLPQVSPGICDIPDGGGVIFGYFLEGDLYHYGPHGLLIGTTAPGEAADYTTGWLDNNSALVVNRDPRDGIIDVFAEDSGLARMIWYRIDDSDIHTITDEVER